MRKEGIGDYNRRQNVSNERRLALLRYVSSILCSPVWLDRRTFNGVLLQPWVLQPKNSSQLTVKNCNDWSLDRRDGIDSTLLVGADEDAILSAVLNV
jgi:hypothetical protein